MASVGAGVFLALTASGQDRGGSPSFLALTGSAHGFAGQGATVRASFEALTASGAGKGNYRGSGAATFEKLVAFATGKRPSGGTFELLAATATGLVGGKGSGLAAFAPLTAVVTGSVPGAGRGTAVFQVLTAVVAGATRASGNASARLRALRASATGLVGGIGSGAGRFGTLVVLGAGRTVAGGSGSIYLPKFTAYGMGGAQLAAVLDTFVVNTRSNAVSKYPLYPANSFASYNGTYLAAGPSGLLLLQGGDDVDADGSQISWTIRTGQLDDKKPGLKRLTEVLAGVRYDGPVRVRIWTDDDKYYDYALPNLRPSTLQQVRAKTGKGLRSRYYKIELSGQGTRLELDSLQATMPETNRRVG